MFYIFNYTPNINDKESDPHLLDMDLSVGVIHQVDILFQDGCVHEQFVQIFQANYQMWPTNRGKSFRGNATVISFRDFFDLTPGNTLLTASIWTTLTSDFKEIIIQIGLLPKRILQPLSFEELLSAASGVK